MRFQYSVGFLLIVTAVVGVLSAALMHETPQAGFRVISGCLAAAAVPMITVPLIALPIGRAVWRALHAQRTTSERGPRIPLWGWPLILAAIGLLALFAVSVQRETREYSGGLIVWLIPASFIIGTAWSTVREFGRRGSSVQSKAIE